MSLDMFMYSLPKIDGMSIQDVLNVAEDLTMHEEKQDEIFEKVKKYITIYEECGFKFRGIQLEKMYWSNANHIHHWFVENVQNGTNDMGMYEVSKEKLSNLMHLCEQIIKSNNIEMAKELLPTWQGPSYGQYDYGSSYFELLHFTVSSLQDLLHDFPFDTHYILYHAEW